MSKRPRRIEHAALGAYQQLLDLDVHEGRVVTRRVDDQRTGLDPHGTFGNAERSHALRDHRRLGAALCRRLEEEDAIRRRSGSRALTVTPTGRVVLARRFGVRAKQPEVYAAR